MLIVRGCTDRDSASILFEKCVLDNGLTVILHLDASNPLVHVDATDGTGSARDELGKSGLAHLVEHMMFRDSANVVGDAEV